VVDSVCCVGVNDFLLGLADLWARNDLGWGESFIQKILVGQVVLLANWKNVRQDGKRTFLGIYGNALATVHYRAVLACLDSGRHQRFDRSFILTITLFGARLRFNFSRAPSFKFVNKIRKFERAFN
jgi:hypothetical protein